MYTSLSLIGYHDFQIFCHGYDVFGTWNLICSCLNQMRPGSQMPLTPSNQSAHLRRDSSHSAHSEMSASARSGPQHYPGGGRGRGGYPPYGRAVAPSPNIPYRQLPGHQRGNPSYPPQYQGQNPMAHQHSPYRDTRSPAITAGMMQQQMHLANSAQMSHYAAAYGGYPQQHLQPQQVYPPSSSCASVSEQSHLLSTKSSPVSTFASLSHTHSLPSRHLSRSIVAPDISPASGGFEQYLTILKAQSMYNMPPQYDPGYGGYYPSYGLGMPYPAAPPSPRPYSSAPHAPHQPYVHGPYMGGTGLPMSRTPSQVSERPGSNVSQPQTPAGPSGSHVSQAPPPKGPSSASPSANTSQFAIPPKTKGKSSIVIRNPEGKVLNFEKKSSPTPASVPVPATKSPIVVSSDPTPPPPPQQVRSPVGPSHTRNESKVKTDAEKKLAFQEQVKRQMEAEKAEEKRPIGDVDQEDDINSTSEQKDRQRAEEKPEESNTTVPAENVNKSQDEAKVQAGPKEREAKEEAERLEREIAEMEEAERKREEAEEAYRQIKNEDKARREAEAAAKADEALKRAEREAEEAEEARQKNGTSVEETAEEKVEREKLFASLKKPTFGPGASVGESRASTPASEPSMPPPPVPSAQAQQPKQPAARQHKPAALKLQTKTIEPAQPTPGMQSLKSARFLQVKGESVSYPDGFASPNPALNLSGKRNGRQYDKSFLLQFQEVFKEKPSTDWDTKVKETVGESDSAKPQSARALPQRQNSRPSIPISQMGNFGQGPRTLPPGTTSEVRFRASTSGSGRTPTMTNPLQSLASRPGGFPVGPPTMSRTNSVTIVGQGVPPSPRPGGSARGRNSRRGGPEKVPSRREEEAMQKQMPLTAGQSVKPLETSTGGWKPISITQPSQPTLLPSGHMAPDMVQRKVKAALNKMTPEKFEKISDQILEIAAQSKDESDGRTLRQVIALTFEKACDEAHWASMYAKFCKRMLETMSPEIKDANVRDKNGNPVVGGALFRKYLLTRCQEEFERGWEVNLPPRPEGQSEEAEMMSDEYYIAAGAKRRGLGLIQFIGELYKLGMLTLRIMHECVHKLLDFEGLPDESAIESLVKLLRTVGATMDSTEAGPKMTAMYFNRIETIMDMDGLPSRMRFMLLVCHSGFATTARFRYDADYK